MKVLIALMVGLLFTVKGMALDLPSLVSQEVERLRDLEVRSHTVSLIPRDATDSIRLGAISLLVDHARKEPDDEVRRAILSKSMELEYSDRSIYWRKSKNEGLARALIDFLLNDTDSGVRSYCADYLTLYFSPSVLDKYVAEIRKTAIECLPAEKNNLIFLYGTLPSAVRSEVLEMVSQEKNARLRYTKSISLYLESLLTRYGDEEAEQRFINILETKPRILRIEDEYHAVAILEASSLNVYSALAKGLRSSDVIEISGSPIGFQPRRYFFARMLGWTMNDKEGFPDLKVNAVSESDLPVIEAWCSAHWGIQYDAIPKPTPWDVNEYLFKTGILSATPGATGGKFQTR